MSCIILRGRWCQIIVLNAHAPTDDKTDDVKGSFYEELEHVFHKFFKYYTKSLMGDFNARVGKQNILSRQLGTKICTKLVMIMLLVVVVVVVVVVHIVTSKKSQYPQIYSDVSICEGHSDRQAKAFECT
jgi:hypothetical protein